MKLAKRKKQKINKAYLPLSLIILLLFSFTDYLQEPVSKPQEEYNIIQKNSIPPFTDEEYIILNGNIPYFKLADYDSSSFEKYSDLDELGRCGVAVANIGIDLMPTKERESIGMIKPTGWHTVKYDFVDGKYLYNRCHLIGYQLTGENANPKNLITCTRNMNAKVMLEFENKVAKYIKETKNNVLYRVTPIYDGDNLLANGVIMEAMSTNDNGNSLMFNVFVYNVEEGVKIDYKTGESEEIK